MVATTDGSTPAVAVKKLLDRSLDEAAEIASMESKNYLEIAQIKYGELCAKIGFDYNGKGEIYSPRLLTGDPQILEALTTYLAPSEVEMTSSPLWWLYERLNQAALNGITISLMRPYQYQDRVALEENGVRAEVRVIYEKRGLITRFELVSGNENLFGKTVEAITSYYNWNTEPGEAAL